MGWH